MVSTLSPKLRNGRLGVLAGHLTETTSCTVLPSSLATASSKEQDDLVVMLESPGEEMISHSEVEKSFVGRGLRLWWAPDDVDPVDLPREAVVLVTVRKQVTKSMLHMLPKLRLVAVSLTGYDHVDLEVCKQRNIAVANVPDYSTDATVELCFGMIFSLLRHIPRAHKHIREGKWLWPPGTELSGKRMGVLGTGNIGTRVAEIAKAFNVTSIHGYDPVQREEFQLYGGQYATSLATLFLHSDVVVICCELNDSTRGLVGAKLMKLLRPDSILVNCARGAIIDQDALVTSLREKRFRAGLDVFAPDILPADSPIRDLPEEVLVTTPHIGYKCVESLQRKEAITLANILAFLADCPQNIVA